MLPMASAGFLCAKAAVPDTGQVRLSPAKNFLSFQLSLRFRVYHQAETRKGRCFTMKRSCFALILSLILCLSLALPAFAEAASPIYDADDLFTSRDLEQQADLSGAVTCAVADGQDIRITAAGVYVLTGSAADVTVYVEAGKDDKVQLVLDGVSIANSSLPVIDVETADKVFITTAGDSTLNVTGTFASDGGTRADGVIFSRTDLTLNGTALLTVSSSGSGIVCRDDLKITGGAYSISAAAKALDANDSIRIAGGTLSLTAGMDGLHAENNEDAAKGYVYIGGGSLTIRAGDDGIHAVSVAQIDGGAVTITAAEGIEGTCIQLNGGTVNIQATDDGINAARKSDACPPVVEINDGDITVSMGAGDTDGIDSNGNIIMNGGTVRVTGNSPFDYDGTAQYNGGVIIVNGRQTAEIPNQMIGGGMGGFGGHGGRGGW